MWKWIKRVFGLEDIWYQSDFTPDPEPVGTLEPVTYSLPGAPPSEHKVRDVKGRIFMRETTTPEDGYGYGPWGSWLQIGDRDGPLPPGKYEIRFAWGPLLHFGPLTLIEFTEQEKADALVYGPPGARWGDPIVPCTYSGCVLGFGHVGSHRDKYREPLGETEADGTLLPRMGGISLHESAADPCTCGHPAHHRPECSRYNRLTGGSDV